MENEVWKPVKGYEDRYEVSNLGWVRSKDMVLPCVVKGVETTRVRRGVLRKPHKGKTGYYYVLLRDKEHSRNFRIHRLVADAFIPNPDNLPQVNHKDEDKSNNRVDNLEWCTSSYNHNYGSTIERAAEKIRRPVYQLTKEGEIIQRFKSVGEAARAVGSATTTISGCCKGTIKTSKGYRWRYAEE